MLYPCENGKEKQLRCEMSIPSDAGIVWDVGLVLQPPLALVWGCDWG